MLDPRKKKRGSLAGGGGRGRWSETRSGEGGGSRALYREFFRTRQLRGRRHGRASGGCLERGCTGVENEPGGVSRSVWWANVCLLAASEPVNHYGLRKRLRPIFALLQPSFSPFNPLARLPLSNPSSSTKHVSLLLRLSLSLVLFSRSVRLVPLRRLLSFIPFVSLSSEFTPLPPRHKHATMLPATAAAHPAYLSELSCHPATRTPTVDRSPL